MKTAEEILQNHVIDYGGIKYIDFDHALIAMKEYALQIGGQTLKDASIKSYLVDLNPHQPPSNVVDVTDVLSTPIQLP